ncbi:MAG: peptide ligase PGM1-related protein [Egibacteraceae bacterium]
MNSGFDGRQRAFTDGFDPCDRFGGPDATIVVLPSISFPGEELRKIVGIAHYEERLLCLLLLLREPRRRMVYVSAVRIDPEVVDYHLGFLPDPDGVRERVTLIALDDPAPRALSAKLLERPRDLARITAAVGDARQAWILPFNVTPLERQVADALDLPLHGPHPDLVPLGSKSGSRRTARRAAVPVLDGAEDLRSTAEAEAAIARLHEGSTTGDGVVIKLNNGFSGQGNAIVALDGYGPPVTEAPTTFCADAESWPSFAAKIARDGAIVERLLTDRLVASPSVQLWIRPGGVCEVLSTHDQILGGPHAQVYLGCRFPAAAEYRAAITRAAVAVGEVLRRDGVIGPFGIDFFVRAGEDGLEVYLSEINLRIGGTTHPFWMAQLVTCGHYDVAAGTLVGADGRSRTYVASDNLKSPRLVGTSPSRVLDTVAAAGLAFDPATGTGATFHLLGALAEYGKLGTTCIAESTEAADDLYREVTRTLAIEVPQ